MGQVYQCWWRICREINVLPDSNVTCFTSYIHLWPIYWLSLVNRRGAAALELLHEQTAFRFERAKLFLLWRVCVCISGRCQCPDYTVSNGGFTDEWKMNWKDTVVFPPTYYPVICTDGLRRTKKYFNQESLCPDSDSNCAPPEYKSTSTVWDKNEVCYGHRTNVTLPI
jgi:hypothetical protein